MTNTTHLTEKLLQGLNYIDDSEIYLVAIDSKLHKTTTMEMLRYLVNEKKMPGVYVTINKPYEYMKESLSEAGIDPRMVIFVDAITKTVGGKADKVNGCIFLNRINDLTDMAVAISNAVQAISTNKKFIVIDSISTLLIYNSNVSVSKFIHFLTGKMRIWKISGILTTLRDNKDDILLSQLTLFCDKRIDISQIDVPLQTNN